MSARPRTPDGVAALWRIAWPVVVSGLVTLFVHGNDAVLLAGSSDRVLASAVAASSVQLVVAMVVAGLVSATQVLVARAVGAGRRDVAARQADAGLWLGAWAGVAAALLLAVAGRPLLGALAGPAVDDALATTYLTVTLVALPCAGVSSALRARLTGFGATRGLLVAAASAAVVDVAAALALERLVGPLGVAAATVAGAVVGAVVLAGFAVRAARQDVHPARPPRVAALWRVRRRDVRAVLTLGWPEAVLFGASSGALVVVVWLLADSPPEALAASRFLELTTSSALFTVLSGLGAAATTLLGRAAGAGDVPGFVRALRRTAVVTGTVAVVVLAVGPVVYPSLLGLVASDAVVAASAPVLWLAFAQAPLMALHVTLAAGLRALKDTRSPMAASLVAEYAVFLPLGWALTRVAGLGLTGVFVAHLAFWLVAVTLVAVRLRTRVRGFADAAPPEAAPHRTPAVDAPPAASVPAARATTPRPRATHP